MRVQLPGSKKWHFEWLISDKISENVDLVAGHGKSGTLDYFYYSKEEK